MSRLISYLSFSIALLLCSVLCQIRFDCEENFCKKSENQCPELNCKNGRVVKNATVCGCCDICVESLGEGKDCTRREYGWRENFKECGSGLFCNSSAKCDATQCMKKLREYSNEDSKLKVNFTCDYFGNYDPIVCISDILCFCVNQSGRRIFGTDLAAKKESMNCKCSRDINNFPKEVEDTLFYPRCLPNGNYDTLQCTEEKCFCMESSNPYEIDVDNDADSMRELSCYNSVLHENSRATNCLREREKQMKLFKKNQTVIGLEEIRCDLDGSYYPVQCNPARCYCVSKNGKIYEDYGTEKKNASQMTCRCLRDKEIMEDSNESTESIKYFKSLQCDMLGNYELITSVTSKYFISDFM